MTIPIDGKRKKDTDTIWWNGKEYWLGSFRPSGESIEIHGREVKPAPKSLYEHVEELLGGDVTFRGHSLGTVLQMLCAEIEGLRVLVNAARPADHIEQLEKRLESLKKKHESLFQTTCKRGTAGEREYLERTRGIR